jgi:carboxylate-amine ligase
MSDALVHPDTGRLAAATDVLDAAVARVRPVIEEAGDQDVVAGLVGRAVHDNGATRQRAALERTGEVTAVVDDLIERTEATWNAPDPS